MGVFLLEGSERDGMGWNDRMVGSTLMVRIWIRIWGFCGTR